MYEFSNLYDEKGLKRTNLRPRKFFRKKIVHQQSTLSSCLKYECWNIACWIKDFGKIVEIPGKN